MNCVNTIASCLMVIITFVYMLYTVKIFKENQNAVISSNAQLEESKRQYEDKKRLEIMPYLQCEQSKGNPSTVLKLLLDSNNLSGTYTGYPIEFVNIGNGTAKDITYIFTNATGSYERNDLPQKALQSGNRMSLVLQLIIPDEALPKNLITFELKYKDLLDNSYAQKIEFYIRDGNMSKVIDHHQTFTPKHIKGTFEGEMD